MYYSKNCIRTRCSSTFFNCPFREYDISFFRLQGLHLFHTHSKDTRHTQQAHIVSISPAFTYSLISYYKIWVHAGIQPGSQCRLSINTLLVTMATVHILVIITSEWFSNRGIWVTWRLSDFARNPFWSLFSVVGSPLAGVRFHF